MNMDWGPAADAVYLLPSNATWHLGGEADVEESAFGRVTPIYITVGMLSLLGAVVVALVFLFSPSIHRDPASKLILLITICDILYTLKFLVSAITYELGLRNPRDSFHIFDDNCLSAAAYGQFFGMACISWNMAWISDFVFVLSNPLRNTASHLRWYHLIVWSMCIGTTIAVLVLRTPEEFGEDHTCWIRGDATNTAIFEAPLVVYMILGVFSIIYALWKLRGGTSATHSIRRRLVTRHATYVVAFILLWTWPVIHTYADKDDTSLAFNVLDALVVSGQALVFAIIRLSEPGAWALFTQLVNKAAKASYARLYRCCPACMRCCVLSVGVTACVCTCGGRCCRRCLSPLTGRPGTSSRSSGYFTGIASSQYKLLHDGVPTGSGHHSGTFIPVYDGSSRASMLFGPGASGGGGAGSGILSGYAALDDDDHHHHRTGAGGSSGRPSGAGGTSGTFAAIRGDSADVPGGGFYTPAGGYYNGSPPESSPAGGISGKKPRRPQDYDGDLDGAATGSGKRGGGGREDDSDGGADTLQYRPPPMRPAGGDQPSATSAASGGGGVPIASGGFHSAAGGVVAVTGGSGAATVGAPKPGGLAGRDDAGAAALAGSTMSVDDLLLMGGTSGAVGAGGIVAASEGPALSSFGHHAATSYHFRTAGTVGQPVAATASGAATSSAASTGSHDHSVVTGFDVHATQHGAGSAAAPPPLSSPASTASSTAGGASGAVGTATRVLERAGSALLPQLLRIRSDGEPGGTSASGPGSPASGGGHRVGGAASRSPSAGNLGVTTGSGSGGAGASGSVRSLPGNPAGVAGTRSPLAGGGSQPHHDVYVNPILAQHRAEIAQAARRAKAAAAAAAAAANSSSGGRAPTAGGSAVAGAPADAAVSSPTVTSPPASSSSAASSTASTAVGSAASSITAPALGMYGHSHHLTSQQQESTAVAGSSASGTSPATHARTSAAAAASGDAGSQRSGVIITAARYAVARPGRLVAPSAAAAAVVRQMNQAAAANTGGVAAGGAAFFSGGGGAVSTPRSILTASTVEAASGRGAGDISSVAGGADDARPHLQIGVSSSSAPSSQHHASRTNGSAVTGAAVSPRQDGALASNGAAVGAVAAAACAPEALSSSSSAAATASNSSSGLPSVAGATVGSGAPDTSLTDVGFSTLADGTPFITAADGTPVVLGRPVATSIDALRQSLLVESAIKQQQEQQLARSASARRLRAGTGSGAAAVGDDAPVASAEPSGTGNGIVGDMLDAISRLVSGRDVTAAAAGTDSSGTGDAATGDASSPLLQAGAEEGGPRSTSSGLPTSSSPGGGGGYVAPAAVFVRSETGDVELLSVVAPPVTVVDGDGLVVADNGCDTDASGAIGIDVVSRSPPTTQSASPPASSDSGAGASSCGTATPVSGVSASDGLAIDAEGYREYDIHELLVAAAAEQQAAAAAAEAGDMVDADTAVSVAPAAMQSPHHAARPPLEAIPEDSSGPGGAGRAGDGVDDAAASPTAVPDATAVPVADGSGAVAVVTDAIVPKFLGDFTSAPGPRIASNDSGAGALSTATRAASTDSSFTAPPPAGDASGSGVPTPSRSVSSSSSLPPPLSRMPSSSSSTSSAHQPPMHSTQIARGIASDALDGRGGVGWDLGFALRLEESLSMLSGLCQCSLNNEARRRALAADASQRQRVHRLFGHRHVSGESTGSAFAAAAFGSASITSLSEQGVYRKAEDWMKDPSTATMELPLIQQIDCELYLDAMIERERELRDPLFQERERQLDAAEAAGASDGPIPGQLLRGFSRGASDGSAGSAPLRAPSDASLSSTASAMSSPAGSTTTASAAAAAAAASRFSKKLSVTTGGTTRFTLFSFADELFSDIRAAAGISAAQIVYSLDPYLLRSGELRAHFSEGASSSFFTRSLDQLLVVKTVGTNEIAELLRLLPAYARHLITNPDSLLCRFYGCYAIVLPSCAPVFFILMGNAFPIVDAGPASETFDLKGSTVGRRARVSRSLLSKAKDGKTVRQGVLLQDMEFRERYPLGLPACDGWQPPKHVPGLAAASGGERGADAAAGACTDGPASPPADASPTLSTAASDGDGSSPAGDATPLPTPTATPVSPVAGSASSTVSSAAGGLPASVASAGASYDLRRGMSRAEAIVSQLTRDVSLLAVHGIMDYSLLINIQPVKDIVPPMQSPRQRAAAAAGAAATADAGSGGFTIMMSPAGGSVVLPGDIAAALAGSGGGAAVQPVLSGWTSLDAVTQAFEGGSFYKVPHAPARSSSGGDAAGSGDSGIGSPLGSPSSDSLLHSPALAAAEPAVGAAAPVSVQEEMSYRLSLNKTEELPLADCIALVRAAVQLPTQIAAISRPSPLFKDIALAAFARGATTSSSLASSVASAASLTSPATSPLHPSHPHYGTLGGISRWSPLAVSICALGRKPMVGSTLSVIPAGGAAAAGAASATAVSSAAAGVASGGSGASHGPYAERALVQIGIIDMLQPYDTAKKAENAFKLIKHAVSHGGKLDADISSVDPSKYAVRFLSFIEKIFLPVNTTVTASGSVFA